MNNLVDDESFDLVDDTEERHGDRFFRGANVALGYDKALWHDIRRTGSPHVVEVSIGASHRRQTEQYLKAFSGWIDAEVHLSHGGMHVGIPVRIRYGPEAVVAFLEDANASEFQRLYGLINARLSSPPLIERLKVIASWVSAPAATALPFPNILQGSFTRVAQPLPLPPPDRQSSNDESSVTGGARAELNDIQGLLASDRIDDGLDKLYGFIDRLLKASQFKTVNSLFSAVDVERAPLDLLLGLLIATLPVKRRAKARAAFFEATRTELERRGEDASRLLNGLE